MTIFVVPMLVEENSRYETKLCNAESYWHLFPQWLNFEFSGTKLFIF